MARAKLSTCQALTIAMGLLSGVRAALSPNCDSRPANLVPELVVVHGISLPPGSYGGPWIERLFMNTLPAGEHPYFETIQHLRVSSHVLIARDGGLTQYVPFGMRAWHAGNVVLARARRLQRFLDRRRTRGLG